MHVPIQDVRRAETPSWRIGSGTGAELDSSPRRASGRRSPGYLARLLLVTLLAGCAGLEAEKHLAPLYSQLSPAGGGSETELFGGALRSRTDGYTGQPIEWAFRPFFSLWPKGGSDYASYLVPPLGKFKREGFEKTWQFIPLFRYHSRIEKNAAGEDRWTWNFLLLPGIYLARDAEGRRVSAFFPIGGHTEHFLSYDEIDFILFPLYARTRRGDRVRYHFLWPIFGWSNSEGGRSFCIWPLFGRSRWDGHYDRWYFLWPIFHWQTNRVLYGEDQEQDVWMVWPFLGRSKRAGYTSTTVLWPFFGYADHESNGYWALDSPWPLVRILEPGETGGPRRVRFWPFYSRYEGDGLEQTWFLWPFINLREEQYRNKTGKATGIFPFYMAEDDWERTEDGEVLQDRYRKVWPLYKTQRTEDSHEFAAPALNPLWRTPVVDYHYAWLWELYTYQRKGDNISQRSWLGIWRRETDVDEDRNSIAGLYASRRYTRLGKRVVERSLLFGLLRWRMVEDEGFAMMRPALPGPGWPIDRAPNSILPELPPPAQPDLAAKEL